MVHDDVWMDSWVDFDRFILVEEDEIEVFALDFT